MFDVLLIGALALCVLTTIVRRAPTDRVNRALRLMAVCSCAIQLLAEGPRVQLVPVYLVASLLAAWSLFDVVKNRQRAAADGAPANQRGATVPAGRSVVAIVGWLARWATLGGATIALVLAAALCLAFPRVAYPKPSGEFAVGTRELRLTDHSRQEFYTTEPDDHRQLLVRVSYPAMSGNAAGHPQDSVPDIAAVGLGAIWANSITPSWGRAATHATVEPPLSEARQQYPVLIFSHGIGGWPEQNTVLVQELASHGYIVMAINHPFLSAGVVFADGSLANINTIRLANSDTPTAEQRQRERMLNAQLADETSASSADQERLQRQVAAVRPTATQRAAGFHQLASDDQRFLLDSLEVLQAGEGWFAGRLDLTRVGVFGMSTGGTASHITCASDHRCRAGLNMDGFQPLLLDLPPLRVPFMHMSNEHNFRHIVPHEQSLAASYVVRVKGTTHFSFTDLVLATPFLSRIGLLGTIDGSRMLALTTDYVLAFFDQYLVGRREPLLDGPTGRYPEVTFLTK